MLKLSLREGVVTPAPLGLLHRLESWSGLWRLPVGAVN